jgi:ribonucleoside-diphosphate reductase alpha chain
VEVPTAWSQVAADVLAQKYFRKAGVPARLRKVEEEACPRGCGARSPMKRRCLRCPRRSASDGERSAKQVFERLAGTWTYWGWKGGYFDSETDARAFFDELVYMLAMQKAAPNSPQWFNTGLHWAYGIDGPSQGHCYVDFTSGKLVKSKSAYEHPQPHACFIQSISDDLVNEGGHHGSVGARGAPLQIRLRHGIEFLGATRGRRGVRGRRQILGPDELSENRRSGGWGNQIRRHHPAGRQDGDRRRRSPGYRAVHRLEGDGRAESRALVTGSKHQSEAPQGHPEGRAECEGSGDDCFDPDKNPVLRREIKAARKDSRARQLHPARDPVRQAGLYRHHFPVYDTDWDSEPISRSRARTPTIRCASPTNFLKAVEADATGTCSGARSPARSPRP